MPRTGDRGAGHRTVAALNKEIIPSGLAPTGFSGRFPIAMSKGCSAPILLNEMIYLTSPVDANDALLCYDSHGTEKWRAVFSKENPGKHRNGSGCNASPVTERKGHVRLLQKRCICGC